MSVDLSAPATRTALPKAATGIRGLDEITHGGLPRGRATLVTGPAGSGKTLFGLEFLVRGALDHGEPGVLLSFEESGDDVRANVASLGYDLARMEADGLLVVDAFVVDPAEIVATGEFDLDGLFIRLAAAVGSVGAARVVLDTTEVLFAALGNEAIVRAELGRLVRWMKDRGLTAVVTGEPGDGRLTRHGVEEYVTDCVIVLDHRVTDQVSTRRLRVSKYRGSIHGTNEYPFLITERGLVVLPVTSLALAHPASTERISIGDEALDDMLGGGIYRGSSVLITGEAGTGKTSLCSLAVDAACQRGERALLVSFEESPEQLVRNMASVGIELQPWLDRGLLRIWSVRPQSLGLEGHLVGLIAAVDDLAPSVVALDAMTGLDHVGEALDVASTFTREVDYLKGRGITALLSSLTRSDGDFHAVAVSSLMDTWISLRNVEADGERNRLLAIRKSRGSRHSNQVREFVLDDGGVSLVEIVVGPDGVLTGSARLAEAARRRGAARHAAQDMARRRRHLDRRAAEVDAQIEALRSELERERSELDVLAEQIEAGSPLLDAAEERAGRMGSGADTSPHQGGSI